MMTEKEFKALEELIRFCEEYGNEEQEQAIQTVADYVNGLYSTGSEPKEKITEMEEKIKEQDKEINDLLKAIKEYERGES